MGRYQHVYKPHLDQNQLVQQYPFAHIYDSDAGHDNECADQKSLRPCFELDAYRIGGLFLLEHHACSDLIFEYRIVTATASRLARWFRMNVLRRQESRRGIDREREHSLQRLY